MVDNLTLQRMIDMMTAHFPEYVREHPREYVLLEPDGSEITARFFKSKRGLDRELRKYKGCVGGTYLTHRIPSKLHRYNPGNNMFVGSIDECVLACPNDRESVLVSGGLISTSIAGGKGKYAKRGYCPDCGYRASRRPAEKAVRNA